MELMKQTRNGIKTTLSTTDLLIFLNNAENLIRNSSHVIRGGESMDEERYEEQYKEVISTIIQLRSDIYKEVR